MPALRSRSTIDGTALPQPDGIWGDWYVEIVSSSTMRELRAALFTAGAWIVSGHGAKRAMVVLANTKVTLSRAEAELQLFRAIANPSVGMGVEFVLAHTSETVLVHHSAEIAALGPEFQTWLFDLISRQLPTGKGSSSQDEVFAYLARNWLMGLGPVTVNSIIQVTGASQPTVTAAIKRLEGLSLIERTSDRRVNLATIPKDEWQHWIVRSAAARRVVSFVDPLMLGSSVERHVAKVVKLGRKGVAIGGLLAARRYMPTLDLSGDIRLDLTVHGSTDLSFIRRVDAGLDREEGPTPKAVIAVHFSSAHRRPFLESDGASWVDPMECMIDLFEMRLYQQLDQYLDFLIGTRPNHRIWHQS